jgi:hypothetical protein
MTPVLKPTSVGAALFRIKADLVQLSLSIKEWRTFGMGEKGIIPISVIPLEVKINSVIAEVEEMICLVSKIS